jgi:clan AA aspartic protease
VRSGHVRDNFPRIALTLSGRDGKFQVEFIIDTGFDGEIALPPSLLSRLDASSSYSRRIRLADGSVRERPYSKMVIDWNDEERLTEVDVDTNAVSSGTLRVFVAATYG